VTVKGRRACDDGGQGSVASITRRSAQGCSSVSGGADEVTEWSPASNLNEGDWETDDLKAKALRGAARGRVHGEVHREQQDGRESCRH
jgi:hypothetical protein